MGEDDIGEDLLFELFGSSMPKKFKAGNKKYRGKKSKNKFKNNIFSGENLIDDVIGSMFEMNINGSKNKKKNKK